MAQRLHYTHSGWDVETPALLEIQNDTPMIVVFVEEIKS